VSNNWSVHDEGPTFRPCWDTLMAERLARGEAVTAPLRRWCLSIAILRVVRAYQYWPHNAEVSTRHAKSLPASASCAVRTGAWMCEYRVEPCRVIFRYLDTKV